MPVPGSGRGSERERTHAGGSWAMTGVAMGRRAAGVGVVAVLLGALLGGLLTAAGDRPALAVTPRDVLVIGISGDVDNLDPHVTMTNRSWAVTYYAYERLVRYKVQDGVGLTEVEPDLATGWTVSDDGLVWTRSEERRVGKGWRATGAA